MRDGFGGYGSSVGEVLADATDASADTTSSPCRNPWNIVLCALGLVALLAAAALLWWSRTTFSDAAIARDQAVAAESEQADLVARDADIEAHRRTLSLAAGDVSTAFQAYRSAFTTLAEDRTKLTDIQNRSIELEGQGHLGASADMLKNEGEPALAELTQAVTALDQTLADLEAKIQKLQEGLVV